MGDKARVAARHIILWLCCWLPRARRKGLERWLRGREEHHKLQRADWVLMSWGKSGRTWLRVMLSRAYQLRGGLPSRALLDFDNLRRANPALPAVFFTHNNYLRDYTGNFESKAHFAGKKIVLLVRDPRDVAVSQFFQWKHRMRPRKKFINDYPPHNADIDLWGFVRDPEAGLPRIVDYFNGWARAIPALGDVLVIRYEDMRGDPGAVLRQVFDFTGADITDDQVAEAVAFAAYDNMRQMERQTYFRGSGARVRPGDRDNPQSFKVRRAKVGGYRDYLDDGQCRQLDALMAGLHPMFGYTGSLGAARDADQRPAQGATQSPAHSLEQEGEGQ